VNDSGEIAFVVVSRVANRLGLSIYVGSRDMIEASQSKRGSPDKE
jgi:hypothetical protein